MGIQQSIRAHCVDDGDRRAGERQCPEVEARRQDLIRGGKQEMTTRDVLRPRPFLAEDRPLTSAQSRGHQARDVPLESIRRVQNHI